VLNIQYFENLLSNFIALKLSSVNKVGNEFQYEATFLTQCTIHM